MSEQDLKMREWKKQVRRARSALLETITQLEGKRCDACLAPSHRAILIKDYYCDCEADRLIKEIGQVLSNGKSEILRYYREAKGLENTSTLTKETYLALKEKGNTDTQIKAEYKMHNNAFAKWKRDVGLLNKQVSESKKVEQEAEKVKRKDEEQYQPTGKLPAVHKDDETLVAENSALKVSKSKLETDYSALFHEHYNLKVRHGELDKKYQELLIQCEVDKQGRHESKQTQSESRCRELEARCQALEDELVVLRDAESLSLMLARRYVLMSDAVDAKQ